MFGDSRLCSCDVFVLSFTSPCMANNNSHVHYAFEQTTWTQGRNRLFELSKQIPYPKLLYYIFLDDDVSLVYNRLSPAVLRGRPPARVFEEWLLKQQPAIGMTEYDPTRTSLEKRWRNFCRPRGANPPLDTQHAVYFDACLNAIHRNASDYLLPYDETFDKDSWWISQFYLLIAAQIQFRGQVIRNRYITMSNPRHRPYPRRINKNIDEIKSYFIKGQVKKVPHQYRQKKFILDLLAHPATLENPESFCLNVPAKQTIVPYQHFTWNITVQDGTWM